ncbi:hypothetical protein TNCV_4297301 [Trichonephila clavipes]|nr:hypothetical protein TNCV_4297301 [Trichonephila clavipes]
MSGVCTCERFPPLSSAPRYVGGSGYRRTSMSAGRILQMSWPVKILHMVAALLFQKLLHKSNEISDPLGSSTPIHVGNHPGAALLGKGSKREETTFTRFRSGQTPAQRHVLKVSPCPNCNLTQAAPAHILACTSYHNIASCSQEQQILPLQILYVEEGMNMKSVGAESPHSEMLWKFGEWVSQGYHPRQSVEAQNY